MIKIRNKRIALMLVLAMLAAMFVGLGTASADTLTYASTGTLTNPTITVANGTTEASAIAALDPTVGIVSIGATADTATIAWTIASYNSTVAGDYTATGVLTLPAGWTGIPANVNATVIVEPPAVVTYASTGTLANSTISVANGTTETDAIAALYPTVGVFGTSSEEGTATVAWTIVNYDATAAGDYTAIGVLTLPAGWTGTPADVTATVTVVASQDTDATLSDLQVNGTTINGFAPTTLSYNVVLPAGTTTVPTVTATVNDSGKANAVVTPATGLPGATTVLVTAQDGVTTQTYTINFTVLFPAPFSDISSSYWGYNAISSLSSKGIVSGYPDGTFKPEASITRAEFATMLVKALGLNTSGTTSTFTDVTADAWYYGYVNAAASANLVAGIGGNMFAPNALITREQMAVMVVNALGTKAPTIAGTELNAFSDKSAVSSWAVSGMEEAVKSGIVSGMTASTIAPLDNATRAQAAEMIYNLLPVLGK